VGVTTGRICQIEDWTATSRVTADLLIDMMEGVSRGKLNLRGVGLELLFLHPRAWLTWKVRSGDLEEEHLPSRR
jgi:hypothetical protein